MKNFKNFKIIDYSDSSFNLDGNKLILENEDVKASLRLLGGSFILKLKNGSGWIFPNLRKKEVEAYIQSYEKQMNTNIEDLNSNTNSINDILDYFNDLNIDKKMEMIMKELLNIKEIIAISTFNMNESTIELE